MEPSGPDPTWTDVVWRERDGLLARIHSPGPDRDPATATGLDGAIVVDVHGGAWNARDRALGDRYNQVLAAAGLTVAAIDFRDGRQARHPAAVDDIAEAIDWVIGHHDLSVDPARIALTGSSSGGHLALHTALTEVSVRFVAALWPPVDPLGRYRYAKTMVGQPVPDGNRMDATGLVGSTEAYFGDETAMGLASIAEIVWSGRAEQLPQVWVAQAGEDLNVPAASLAELETAYIAAGGVLERTVYPGEIHGFGHGSHPGATRFHRDLTGRLLAALR